MNQQLALVALEPLPTQTPNAVVAVRTVSFPVKSLGLKGFRTGMVPGPSVSGLQASGPECGTRMVS